MNDLLSQHDVLLLDLDGTVYLDNAPIPYAVECLLDAVGAGVRLAYVTNNAARTPGMVGDHLRKLGLPARDEEIVTSSMAAASIVRSRYARSGSVLAVGGPGVAWALREQGLEPVTEFKGDVIAVVQGYGPDVRVRDLAEACFAVSAGVPWIAANEDLVLPTTRGLSPGNGSLVRLVAQATGRSPDVVAGKPESALIEEAIVRAGALRPLIVGDRLDTDIAAGARMGIPTLLVLTGVTTAQDLHAAPTDHRPTYVATDLRGLIDRRHRTDESGKR